MESPNTDEVGASSLNNDEADLIWGAENIGREIDRTKEQVYRLYKKGAFKGAVAKFGHRTFVGSRKRLQNLKLVDLPCE
jgi:hypothetical protein